MTGPTPVSQRLMEVRNPVPLRMGDVCVVAGRNVASLRGYCVDPKTLTGNLLDAGYWRYLAPLSSGDAVTVLSDNDPNVLSQYPWDRINVLTQSGEVVECKVTELLGPSGALARLDGNESRGAGTLDEIRSTISRKFRRRRVGIARVW